MTGFFYTYFIVYLSSPPEKECGGARCAETADATSRQQYAYGLWRLKEPVPCTLQLERRTLSWTQTLYKICREDVPHTTCGSAFNAQLRTLSSRMDHSVLIQPHWAHGRQRLARRHATYTFRMSIKPMKYLFLDGKIRYFFNRFEPTPYFFANR